MNDTQKKRRIAFIVQYPKGISPGQRFRFELWEPTLLEAGIQCQTFPFFDNATRQIIYQKGQFPRKALGVLLGYVRRIQLLFTLHRFEFIVVQREFAPFGPPIFEFLVSKILGLRLVYDFDDAIWIPTISAENSIAARLKSFWKVGWICRWSHKISVGNRFLATYSTQFNDNVIIVPTCVDTDRAKDFLKAHVATSNLIVGWTGSFSTLKYLEIIVPALKQAQELIPFKFVVIADREPELPGVDFEFKKWSEETELEDLSVFDIGVMPLIPDKWSEGKCGFKLIQYFSLGIPALASPVGVNSEILEHGISGYLCSSQKQWVDGLCKMLSDVALRQSMGSAGRKHVVENYSVNANASKYLSLFCQ